MHQYTNFCPAMGPWLAPRCAPHWTACALRSILRRRRVPGRSRLRSKAAMWDALRRDEAAAVIQRTWRRHALPRVLNDSDTITQDLLPAHMGRCFTYRVQDGNGCIAYFPQPLYEYVQHTGDRQDPITRQPFSDADLGRLARQARQSPGALAKAVQRRHRVDVAGPVIEEMDDTELLMMVARDFESESQQMREMIPDDDAYIDALMVFVAEQWHPTVGLVYDMACQRNSTAAADAALTAAREYLADSIEWVPPPVRRMVLSMLMPQRHDAGDAPRLPGLLVQLIIASGGIEQQAHSSIEIV